MRILDVGCGNNKVKGAIGVDISPNTQADVIHDLDSFPYPFRDDEFDVIYCNHIVEHVADVVRFMDEIYRVAKPGAIISLVTPHFSNPRAYADPTHRRYLSVAAFDFLLDGKAPPNISILDRVLEIKYPPPTLDKKARFEKIETRLKFGRPFRYTGIQWLANRFLNAYEFYFCGIFPARDIYVKLRVIK
ncbi:MAG: methyltransferase domain-containing protein [Chloroflexi bacterium]|nr:methyltransferase domain-containing protein [Chloroflexota bacterium]MDA8186767.1 methyltransferase domain-containing protein [Dehalococcoidales bacterium]